MGQRQGRSSLRAERRAEAENPSDVWATTLEEHRNPKRASANKRRICAACCRDLLPAADKLTPTEKREMALARFLLKQDGFDYAGTDLELKSHAAPRSVTYRAKARAIMAFLADKES